MKGSQELEEKKDQVPLEEKLGESSEEEKTQSSAFNFMKT